MMNISSTKTRFCLGANESKSAANGAARTKEQVSRLDSTQSNSI